MAQKITLLIVLLPFLWLLLAGLIRRLKCQEDSKHGSRGSNTKLITLVVLCGNNILKTCASGGLPATAVAASDGMIDAELYAKRMLNRMGGCVVFQFREMPPMYRLCEVDDDEDQPVFIVELLSGDVDECTRFWEGRYDFVSLDEELEWVDQHVLREIRGYQHRIST